MDNNYVILGHLDEYVRRLCQWLNVCYFWKFECTYVFNTLSLDNGNDADNFYVASAGMNHA